MDSCQSPTAPASEHADELDILIERLDHGFRAVAQFFHLTAQPVPEIQYPSMDDPTSLPEREHGYWTDLLHTRTSDWGCLEDVLKLEAQQKPWDDRKYLLERMIEVSYEDQ